MPVYEYCCPYCFENFAKMKPMSECKEPAYCPKCAGVGERNYIGEHVGSQFSCATWPIKSEALGVHPDQISEAREQSIALGVPTEFTKDGRPILTGPKHRKRYAEALGFWDKNGGFSDPQRK